MILNNYFEYLRILNNTVFEIVDSSNYACNMLTGMINTAGNGQLMLKGYTRYYTSGNMQQHYTELFNQLSFKQDTNVLLSQSNSTLTVNTYNLSDTVSFSNQSYNISTVLENNATKLQVTYSGVNNTGNDVTIKKVGITKKFYHIGDTSYTITGGSYNSTVENVLMFVYELENPITVEAGRTFSFTFDIDISAAN